MSVKLRAILVRILFWEICGCSASQAKMAEAAPRLRTEAG